MRRPFRAFLGLDPAHDYRDKKQQEERPNKGHRHFFMDTEFMDSHEGAHGEIDLISIGIVDEQGRTYYAINKEADFSGANYFVQTHVMDKLPDRSSPEWKSAAQIRAEVTAFLMPDDKEPHVWTWYGATDQVLFVWLLGGFPDVPAKSLKVVRDLKFALPFFEAVGGLEIPAPPEPENAHHALADAQWLRAYWANVESALEGLEWFESL